MSTRPPSALNLNQNQRASSTWKTHMAVAGMAYDRGLYSAAGRNYYSALQAAEQLGFSEQQLLPILLGLAMCKCQQSNFCEADRAALNHPND